MTCHSHVEADVLHQRDERVEDLAHAAAERGGGEVHDARALQRLGERADLLDEVAPDDVRVVGERLVADGDGLEHERECTRAARPSAVSPRAASQRTLAELDAQRPPLAVAEDRERAPSGPGRSRSSVCAEVVVRAHRVPADRDDDVAAARYALVLEALAVGRRRAGPPRRPGRPATTSCDPRAVVGPAARSARRAAGTAARSTTPR